MHDSPVEIDVHFAFKNIAHVSLCTPVWLNKALGELNEADTPTAILKGLKKYGMFVADNGIEWAISVAPDPRIPVLHEELRRVKGAAFEVVVPPGAVGE